MKRIKIVFTLIILTSFLVVSSYNTTNLQAIEPLANLVFKTAGGGSWGDYGLYAAQYLRDIGIELEIKVEEFSVLVGELVLTHDYDIAFVGLGGGGASPDMRDVFSEDGSLNAFGLTRDMPYGNLSENMQNEGVTISDLDQRQQHYYDWQQLLMDKILPCLPFYAPRSYIAIWANTLGYDYRWGFIDCSPYMSYDGYHDGQVSLDEFNYASANWRELNPLFSDDTSSSFIFNLGDEQMIAWSPENAPLKTGLVHEWEQIDDFHYKFYMRDNIFWNPSYNVTGRDASSDPLGTIPTGELMLGLKNGEYSDGTNQQVTAKDAVFTYLAWSNPIVSESPTYHDWISDIYVDPVDPLAYHIHIDGNPSTPEVEPYVDFWARLPWRILPEFFLNSTDSTVSYTSGGVECVGLYTDMISTAPWVTYSTSAFGCGKFMLDYYIRNSITVLRRSPYWFGVGALDGTTGLQPFVETVNIRVIPDVSAELAEFKAGKL
ncbi:MAG: ABC transporter substrate-binding protein, partial [Candidatus Heimdallarchaeaceae archaeon]